MGKKTLYIFSALVLTVLCVAGWLYYQSKLAKKNVSPQVLIATETASKAQSGVGNAVQNTNPFGADVNPIQGYKNPFE